MSRNGYMGVLDRCVIVASSSVKAGASFMIVCIGESACIWCRCGFGFMNFFCPPRVSGRYPGKHMVHSANFCTREIRN